MIDRQSVYPNLIRPQNSCSGTNPGIVMSPNLPLFHVEVGLRPTMYFLSSQLVEIDSFMFDN